MNWAGVISVVVGAVVGSVLSETGVTPLGFVVSLVIVLVLYPILRLYVLRAPKYAPDAAVAADAATN